MIDEYKNFAVLITTHGRPNCVHTYNTLRKLGYTGKIILVVDNLDKTLPEYIEKFGDEVVVFDKPERAKSVDKADNLPDLCAVVFARNECFDIAERLGIEIFLQVDDDYTTFQYRFDEKLLYRPSTLKANNLDNVFPAFVKFMRDTPVHCIAMAQGGDFIGGNTGEKKLYVRASRKVMNTFFLSTKKRFKFFARMNDDVTTYTYGGSIGQIFITTNQINILQPRTQLVKGGMTEVYQEHGTYVKSFYSILFHPSSIKISTLEDKLGHRLHHSIAWRYTVPKILREEVKKPRE